jgi:hypothetical protein
MRLIESTGYLFGASGFFIKQAMKINTMFKEVSSDFRGIEVIA